MTSRHETVDGKFVYLPCNSEYAGYKPRHCRKCGLYGKIYLRNEVTHFENAILVLPTEYVEDNDQVNKEFSEGVCNGQYVIRWLN